MSEGVCWMVMTVLKFSKRKIVTCGLRIAMVKA